MRVNVNPGSALSAARGVVLNARVILSGAKDDIMGTIEGSVWLTVLGQGLTAAAQRPLLALLLYLANLLPALLATVLAGLTAAGRPWVVGLLGGDWLNVLVEIAAAALASGGLGEVALPILLLASIGGAALLVQALLYAFAAGGILERLRDADGPPLSFRSGCRRWFWPFVRLGLLGMIPYAGLAIAGLAALVLLGPAPALLGGAACLGVLGGWLELARAGMVARRDPGAAAALRRAARLVLRSPWLPQLILVWLVLATIGSALGVAQLATGTEPLAGPISAQAALVAGAWFKVARLATALAIDRHVTHAPG